MAKIKCSNCGYEKDIIATDIDYYRHEKCFICQGEYKFDRDSHEIDNIPIYEVIKQDMVEQMEDNIISLGHQRTWEILEKFIDPLQRIAYRKLFFQAGGEVPKHTI